MISSNVGVRETDLAFPGQHGVQQHSIPSMGSATKQLIPNSRRPVSHVLFFRPYSLIFRVNDFLLLCCLKTKLV